MHREQIHDLRSWRNEGGRWLSLVLLMLAAMLLSPASSHAALADTENTEQLTTNEEELKQRSKEESSAVTDVVRRSRCRQTSENARKCYVHSASPNPGGSGYAGIFGVADVARLRRTPGNVTSTPLLRILADPATNESDPATKESEEVADKATDESDGENKSKEEKEQEQEQPEEESSEEGDAEGSQETEERKASEESSEEATKPEGDGKATVETERPVEADPPQDDTKKRDGKSGSSKEPKKKKCIIGATATLLEKQSELKFRARVDSGAKSCSLHFEKIKIENESKKEDIAQRMTENIGKVIHFEVKNGDDKTHILTSKIAGYVIIKNSNKKEGKRRYKVPLTFRWKSMEKEVLVTLSDRNHMEYPLLLGRNFLRGDFLVDVELDSDD